MVKIVNKTRFLLCFILIGLIIYPLASFSFQSFSRERGKQFESIGKALDAKDYGVALGIIAKIRNSGYLNSMERAYVHNYLGNIHFELGELHLARDEFQQIIEIKDHLSAGFTNQIVYVLAQIEYSLKNYYESIGYLRLYSQTEESDKKKTLAMFGQAYYMAGEFCKAHGYTNAALAESSLLSTSKKKNLQNLLNAIKSKTDYSSLVECTLKKITNNDSYKQRILEADGDFE